MVFGSTLNGVYDLYNYDGSRVPPLTELNTDKNELGADFFDFDSAIGDVNADGEFNIADLVLFQKWLLASPDAKLKNCQNVDLCNDGRLDVFDLCLMRRELVERRYNTEKELSITIFLAGKDWSTIQLVLSKETPCRFHTLQGVIFLVLPNLLNMANPTAEVIISVMGYVSQK